MPQGEPGLWDPGHPGPAGQATVTLNANTNVQPYKAVRPPPSAIDQPERKIKAMSPMPAPDVVLVRSPGIKTAPRRVL